MTSLNNEIQFIDTTIRDGNQSLWDATGLTTSMILSIAPVMDRVGFKAVDFITGTLMAVSVRWHKENPWEKIRLVCKAMEKTPLSFGGTGRRFMGWKRVPESVMALALKLVIDSGIKRVWLLDPSFDIDFILRQAKMAKQAGAEEFVVPLSYTISPIHTDEFYAQKAAAIVASPDVDGIYIKDQGGLLTVDRIRTLVPAIQQNIKGLPLEIHSHCNTGLAPLVYLEAIHPAALGLALDDGAAVCRALWGCTQWSGHNAFAIRGVLGMGWLVSWLHWLEAPRRAAADCRVPARYWGTAGCDRG